MIGFLKGLLPKPKPSPRQLATLEAIARITVLAVEKPGVPGQAKKAQALGIVGDLAKQVGLPVPDLLIDLAIEGAVRSLPRGERA